MKVSVELLKSFVKKASLNGEIPTMNLDFLEDGLYASVYDFGTVALTITKLDSSSFEDYTALGETSIRNTGLFLKMLSAFDEVVEISRPENHFLKIKENKQTITLMLAARSVLSNLFQGDRPKISTTISGVLSKNDSKRILKSTSLLQEDSITFEFNNNVLSLSVGDKTMSDHSELIIDGFSGDGDSRVTVGKMFSNFLKIVDNDVEVAFTSKAPIYLKEISDGLCFEVYIAPIID